MDTQTWFKDWFNSPYYHQLYFNRDEQEAATFIDLLIEHVQPQPNARLLDVACGKGRHSIQMALKGFDVTGIDLSEDSIAEAQTHATENLHFFRHDMRLPFWINYFDIAFNFFTSFGYFTTRREHDNAIRTIAQSVKSEGKIVIDYLNVQYSIDNFVPNFSKEIDGVHYQINKWFDDTHFYKKITVEDKLLKTPLIYTEKVAKFNLADFTTMMSNQHVQLKEVYGDYFLGEYDEKKSPRLLMIAEKK
jgi:2-polyprenyl-3-methyl-5-hydroxy-6-metoxy-1,4-benzoquinol methylase